MDSTGFGLPGCDFSSSCLETPQLSSADTQFNLCVFYCNSVEAEMLHTVDLLDLLDLHEVGGGCSSGLSWSPEAVVLTLQRTKAFSPLQLTSRHRSVTLDPLQRSRFFTKMATPQLRKLLSGLTWMTVTKIPKIGAALRLSVQPLVSFSPLSLSLCPPWSWSETCSGLLRVSSPSLKFFALRQPRRFTGLMHLHQR